jgi:hypothetical protein
LGYFIPWLSLSIELDKSWVGLHFGRFFNKLIWSPWKAPSFIVGNIANLIILEEELQVLHVLELDELQGDGVAVQLIWRQPKIDRQNVFLCRQSKIWMDYICNTSALQCIQVNFHYVLGKT